MITRNTGAGRSGHRVVTAAVLAGVLSVAGCGDDDPQARYCEAGESLRESVAGLADVDLVGEGTSGLEAALGAVRDDVDELSDAAGDAAAGDVDALGDAVDSFFRVLSDLGGDASGPDVLAALGDVQSSAGAVFATLADC